MVNIQAMGYNGVCTVYECNCNIRYNFRKIYISLCKASLVGWRQKEKRKFFTAGTKAAAATAISKSKEEF